MFFRENSIFAQLLVSSVGRGCMGKVPICPFLSVGGVTNLNSSHLEPFGHNKSLLGDPVQLTHLRPKRPKWVDMEGGKFSKVWNVVLLHFCPCFLHQGHPKNHLGPSECVPGGCTIDPPARSPINTTNFAYFEKFGKNRKRKLAMARMFLKTSHHIGDVF